MVVINMIDDRLYWLWLSDGLGIASPQLRDLLDTYETAGEIYKNLVRLRLDGMVTEKQHKQLSQTKPNQFETMLNNHLERGYSVLSYSDEDYPSLLKTIDAPPLVLYTKGNNKFLNKKPAIGIVGTRRPSAYGVEATRLIGDGLAAAGVVIVSGMADGLDSESHKASVRASTPTIAVLGTAIDICFPARNKILRGLIEECGVVISEFPIGTPGQGAYFLLRNRIIAGLSQGLCVIEARKRSGTMSTVRYGLEYGRDIYAVPGSIFSLLSEGTNGLISDGAKPIASAADVLTEYADDLTDFIIDDTITKISVVKAEPLSDIAKKVLSVLNVTPQGVAEICKKSELSPAICMAAITELEMADRCIQQPGRLFVIRT